MPRRPNRFVLILCMLGCVLLICSSVNSVQDRHSAAVVVVYDGDTVGVEFPDGLRRKVRLIGIDSPELNHPDEQVRLLAQLSKRFVFHCLYKKQVILTYDWEREDIYGRLLAYIWTEENLLFNEFILVEGFASAYLRFPFKEDYKKRFSQAEKSARSSNKGLWREEPYPIVSLEKIFGCIGQTAAVEYTCREVQTKGSSIFLQSADQKFSTLILKNSRNLFADVFDFKGQVIHVQGFVEEYHGQPQIIAFFPRQIQAVGTDKKMSVKKETRP